jgi:CheY-like chemotaxis protein
MPLKASSQRPTALIVEDDRPTREGISLYLSTFGVNTVEAEDGLHGLATATSIVPDIIATDLSLPRMNGIEFCRTLKQQQQTRDIPVIMLTGSIRQSEVEAAKKAGCISVLIKPCPPAKLLEEIRRILALPAVR